MTEQEATGADGLSRLCKVLSLCDVVFDTLFGKFEPAGDLFDIAEFFRKRLI